MMAKGEEEGEPCSLIAGNAAMHVEAVTTNEAFHKSTLKWKPMDQSGQFITTVFPSAVEVIEDDLHYHCQ